MKKYYALLVSACLLAGCQSHDGYDVHGPIPSDAKITDEKIPTINANTHYAAGQLAESSNRIEPAIEQYNEALEVDPKHAPSLYRLGVLHAQREEYPAAVDAWQRYIKVTDDSATGWGNLAFCYELMNKQEDAEASYKKGIDREPKNQMCRVNYGLMLARIGKTNDALTQFQAVLSPAAAHYNVGSVYEAQKKFAQAKMEYTRALEFDPTFFDAQQRLASIGEQ